MAHGIPVQVFRGGRSRGAYFRGGDLPADPAERDRLLSRLLDRPYPLAAQVALVDRCADPSADVDYRFLRLDGEAVTEPRPCGDLLAGVGPFAVERGLVAVAGDTTAVRVRMPATGARATVHVPTPGGRAVYAGDTAVSGVPGTAARLLIEFETVPKMCLLAPPAAGGSLSTRTFLSHRVHASIGIRAAVGVGAAAILPGSVAARLLRVADRAVVPRDVLRLEHPTGFLDVVPGSSVVSTARLVLDGHVFAF